jgi:hypothetical protein
MTSTGGSGWRDLPIQRSAAVVPSGHVLGSLRVQHAMPAVRRQYPPSHPRLHTGYHVGDIDSRGHKGEGLTICRREHAIADAAVIVVGWNPRGRTNDARHITARADSTTRSRRNPHDEAVRVRALLCCR